MNDATTLQAKPLDDTSPTRRLRIYFEDDAVRQRTHDAMHQLLATAAAPDTTSNSSRLARKALQYRKLLARVEGVDVTSPEFDASKFLGVDWCHTPDLKHHCAQPR